MVEHLIERNVFDSLKVEMLQHHLRRMMQSIYIVSLDTRG